MRAQRYRPGYGRDFAEKSIKLTEKSRPCFIWSWVGDGWKNLEIVSDFQTFVLILECSSGLISGMEPFDFRYATLPRVKYEQTEIT